MEITVEFYSKKLQKVEYDPNNLLLDFSTIENKDALVPGEEYICMVNEEDECTVDKAYPLKAMKVELRKVQDSSPYESAKLCSVKVLEYEYGTEYPKVENVVVAGYFYNTYAEAVFDTKGFWAPGKDGREIFFITERTQTISSSENSIKKYLCSILRGTGMGKALVAKLFAEYGLELLEKIKANDDGLKKLIKSEEKRTKLIEAVSKNEDGENALNLLLHHGIPAETAISIIKSLGSTAFSILSGNPYALLKFSSVPIETTFNLIKSCGKPFVCTENIKGLIMRYIDNRKSGFGDIYIERSSLMHTSDDVSDFEVFYDKNSKYPKFSNTGIEKALSELADEKRIVICDNVEGTGVQCIYEKGCFDKENVIVRKLLHASKTPSACFVPEDEVRAVLGGLYGDGIKLDAQQEAAIVKALTNKISVISGGPGTGKTLVTKGIVDAFLHFFPSKKIQLCAPTGKASRRMSEVIGMPACTLHKKLGFGTDIDMFINEDILIVDECSMIDIDLFHKMLTSVGRHTTIVLVGDYNQLPSVGPGLILRDIIDSGAIPCTTLTSVFRQADGSEITNAANAVLNNRPNDLNKEFGKDFVFIERNDGEDVYNAISGCVKYLLDRGIDPDAIQILTPQNEGQVGTTGLNNMMRELCNPELIRGTGTLVGKTVFYRGDRIIETENDSALRIYNGSLGHIVGIDEDGFLADFDDHRVLLKQTDMRTIKLGYALTVHKAQGSEFDYVFMPVLKEHEFTLNKNLLYTAITRAKKMFVLFGQPEALRNTVAKEVVWDRRSQIKQKLALGAKEN